MSDNSQTYANQAANQANQQGDRNSQYNFYFDGKPASPGEPLVAHEYTIPTLLPFLANRKEQEKTLRKSVKRALAQRETSPIIFVVHGDEFQSHDMFLERMTKIYLPKLLQSAISEEPLKRYHLSWPSEANGTTEFHEQLCACLGDIVNNDTFANLEQISGTIERYPSHTIVHSHFLTEDWASHRFQVIQEFLNFWGSWPPISSSHQLFVFLFVKYQVGERKRFCRDGFWLKGIFDLFIFLLRKRRYKRCNADISSQLACLDKNSPNGLSVFVLPELKGISLSHVEEWARGAETRAVIGEVAVAKLLPLVNKIFREWEESTLRKTIPMEDLSVSLEKSLKSLLNAKI